MATRDSTEITKKGYSKDQYRNERVLELAKCMVDPLHFIQNYMVIQHPLEGRIPFVPYPYQVDMIKAFHEHRNVVALTSRQMGKCVVYDTEVTKDGYNCRIGDLVTKLSLRQKLVTWLERKLVTLATREWVDIFAILGRNVPMTGL
jgi:hypothetical protein